MKKLNNIQSSICHPVWMLLAASLPQTILIWFYTQADSLFNRFNFNWGFDLKQLHFYLLILIWLGFTVYALYTWRIKKIHLTGIFALLASSLLYLSTYFIFKERNFYLEKIIDNYYSVPLACIMPGILYSIILIINHYTPSGQNARAWLNFIISLMIPAATYLYTVVIFPLYKYPETKWSDHLNLILYLLAVILFLAFFIRTMLILFKKEKEIFIKLQYLWKFLFGLVFPFLGLYFNYQISGGLFGNFHYNLFYLLVFLNGLFLIQPRFKKFQLRLSLFLARIFLSPVSLYFLIVFLPYIPLSVLAMIVFGMGILLLTPLILSVIQMLTIRHDYQFLKALIPKHYLWLMMILCFSILPASVLITYHLERQTINKALDYVYQPAYGEKQKITFSTTHLTNILSRMKARNYRYSKETPYLTPLYKKIVLNNCRLSLEKIKYLKKVFFNHPYSPPSTAAAHSWQTEKTVQIRTTSVYKPENRYYSSWLHLSIQNPLWNQQEFITALKIPDGTFIGNYYLRLDGKDQYGQLVEKKAAVWIYNQIVSRLQDPGIITYQNKNTLTLKIFPVPAKGVRFTGIELIHPQPITVQLANRSFQLGQADHINQQICSLSKKIIYIPPRIKKQLTRLKRNPYYHFILDYSLAADSTNQNQIEYYQDIKQVLQKKLIPETSFKITLANYEMHTFSVKSNINHKKFKSLDFQGGFDLGRVLKTLLYNEAKHPTDQFPVFIVLSPAITNAVYYNDLSFFQYYYPELNQFYYYKDDKLYAQEFSKDSLSGIFQNQINKITWPEVLAWPDNQQPQQFLPDNNKPSLVFRNSPWSFTQTGDQGESRYQTALETMGIWQHHLLHPEQTETDWWKILKTGYSANILSPATAFIVVETEQQRQQLAEAHNKIMKNKKYYDYEPTSRKMSEPGLMISLILMLIIIYGVRHSTSY